MLVIGELINGMYKAVGKAIADRDKTVIQKIAKDQVAAGAGMLDVNTGPYEKNNYSIVRADDIPCAPCVKNECPYGTSQCLLDIKEEIIIERAAQLLN